MIILPPKILDLANNYVQDKVTVESHFRTFCPQHLDTYERKQAFVANAKRAEAACASHLGLDPVIAVNWIQGDQADPGYDLIKEGWRIDVKSTNPGRFLLIWPAETGIEVLPRKKLDFLALIIGEVDMWNPPKFVAKGDFLKHHTMVRNEGKKLRVGTAFMHNDDLDSWALALKKYWKYS